MKRDLDAKTTLTANEYRAMEAVVLAKGMTQAGYIRNLILTDICDSQDTVSKIEGILQSVKRGGN